MANRERLVSSESAGVCCALAGVNASAHSRIAANHRLEELRTSLLGCKNILGSFRASVRASTYAIKSLKAVVCRRSKVITAATITRRAVEVRCWPPGSVSGARGGQDVYPFTLIFANDRIARPLVGWPKLVAGLNTVKIIMFFSSGITSLALSGADKMR